MLKREQWLDLSRQLDWTFRYVTEKEAYPVEMTGEPWLPAEEWKDWDEPYKDTYREYVENQLQKDQSILAVRDAVGGIDDWKKLDPGWIGLTQLHFASVALGEYAAGIAELRMARFGRHSAWRNTALFGGLDEIRHTQIPIGLCHSLVKQDAGYDWAHKLFFTDQWVSVGARALFDDLSSAANVVETICSLNQILEIAFTNLQFVALTAMADAAGDPIFEKALNSIQTDESRHAQQGPATLQVLIKHDKAKVQYLLDKQFWRNWRVFSIVTGPSMDYLTPVHARRHSFKEFMQEWIIDQYMKNYEQFGLERPWYWDIFMEEIDHIHHGYMIGYYTYRQTMWFDWPRPLEADRAWLCEKYPGWDKTYGPLWDLYAKHWEQGQREKTLPSAIVTLCNCCHLPCSPIRPHKNTVCTHNVEGRNFVFCSEPCKWIFAQEYERYGRSSTIIDRVFSGKAPQDYTQLYRDYMQVSPNVEGQDIFETSYANKAKAGTQSPAAATAG